jgi:hypothetical protein
MALAPRSAVSSAICSGGRSRQSAAIYAVFVAVQIVAQTCVIAFATIRSGQRETEQAAG